MGLLERMQQLNEQAAAIRNLKQQISCQSTVSTTGWYYRSLSYNWIAPHTLYDLRKAGK